MPTTPETLLLTTGPLEIQAAAAGAGKKVPRIRISAYGGGIVTGSSYWPNWACDLGGLDRGGQVPLLADHNSTLEGVAGYGTARIVDGRSLEIEGTLLEATTAGRQILDLARAGMSLQASVGLESLQSRYVREGETVHVNGRTLTAPAGMLRLVEKSRLRECSVLPIGADVNTSVDVAAKGRVDTTSKESHMPQSATVLDAPETIEAARTGEAERVSVIEARAAFYSTSNPSRATAIKAAAETATAAGATAAECEVQLMRASRPAWTPPIMHNYADPASPDVLSACWLLHAGKSSLAEKVYGGTVAQQAADLGCHSSVDILAASLRANGHPVPRGRPELIKLAFSTNTCTAMGSAVQKVAIAAYEDTPQTWRSFCAIKSVPNFRTTTGIRPTFGGNLEVLASGGEVKHGTLGEETYDFAVHTEAKMLRLTREAVVNDDLGMIQDTGAGFGQMAMRSLSDCVWRVILAGVSTGHFAAGRANYLTGGTSVLGIGGLTLAVAALRNQRDIQNNDLDLRPAALVVPSELEMIGRQLLESAEVLAVAAGDPMGNALKGLASLQVESRLSNLIKFPVGALTTCWFLFAGVQASPAIVAFLDGREQPTLEFYGLDNDPQTLGVTWRIFHDYGAALADYRAAVRSDGV